MAVVHVKSFNGYLYSLVDNTVIVKQEYRHSVGKELGICTGITSA